MKTKFTHKYFILTLLIFIFISCNSESGTENGKTYLQTAHGLCGEEFSSLSSRLEECSNNAGFQNSMTDYSCTVFDDTRLKTMEDVDLMDQCIFKIRDLTCDELSSITKSSDIENCYMYDKEENYRTKKEICVEGYHGFCLNLYHACEENLTSVCEEAKYFNTSSSEDPTEVHFNTDTLGNYCNSDDGSEKVTLDDLKCHKTLNTCEDFQAINFDIEESYTDCFPQE